jgi:hypothetical protein
LVSTGNEATRGIRRSIPMMPCGLLSNLLCPFGTYKFEGWYFSLRKEKFEDPHLRNHAINQKSLWGSWGEFSKNNIYQFHAFLQANICCLVKKEINLINVTFYDM